MQEHLLSPYESLPCTPTATYGLDKQVFKNWDPFVNQRMDLPTALAAVVRHLLLPARRPLLRAAGATAASRCSSGRARFGFGAPTGIDIGPEAPGLVPTPDWRQAARSQTADWRSTGLEAGRLDPARDRPGRPDRDAAPDGALLRDDRERRQARHAARRSRTSSSRARTASRRSLRRFAPTPPQPRGVDPRRARRSSSEGLYAGDALDATARRPACSATSRSRSPARPARPRRSSQLPGYPAGARSRTSRGGAATGRPTTPKHRRLRRDRERRPRRRPRRRRRRCRSSRSTSTQKAPTTQTLVNAD